MRSERQYQRRLVNQLKELFPGCYIEQKRAGTQQGMPDILILWRNRWAMLEVKRDSDSDHRPNQDFYINKFSGMAFASFIYPENEEQVLYDLQTAFGAVR